MSVITSNYNVSAHLIMILMQKWIDVFRRAIDKIYLPMDDRSIVFVDCTFNCD